MNYTLIMLDIPVLVSDEFDERGRKIIAGFFGKPKLDLSLIADEIGWVDVYKLAYKYIQDEWSKDDDTLQFGIKVGFRQGFETAQSLNEKKWIDDDMIDFHNFIFNHPNQFLKMGEYLEEFKQSIKPKEYLVNAIFDEKNNSYKITEIV